MNITFHINYNTAFGEELMINVNGFNATDKCKVRRMRMHTSDGSSWSYRLDADIFPGTVLTYYYSVVNGDDVIREEWRTVMHRFETYKGYGYSYQVMDRWYDIPVDAYLYSSAFTDCVNRHAVGKGAGCPLKAQIRLKVRAPQLRRNDRLVMVGNCAALGAWNVYKALPMRERFADEWVADIDVCSLGTGRIEFKFVVLNDEAVDTPLWENGFNRELDMPRLSECEGACFDLPEATFPMCQPRYAGTLVPVFSLRSRDSFGVGDFGDLKKMIDWVAQTGQRVLQVLPINDTTATRTWRDCYPYSCISVFALHPQYIDLNALPPIRDEKKRKRMEMLRQELNSLRQIDYERVNAAKNEYMSILFAERGRDLMAGGGFKKFFPVAQKWLVPYAQFCMLRDKYGTADFSKWKGHETWHESDRAALTNPHTGAYAEAAYYYYVQYLLNKQMASVHDYARKKGVILKGDIPIGVSRYGCDVWQEPRYFNLNGQAGAPPDDFSVNGQNWGFPTYNWQAMLRDGCAWWVRRFQNMSKFFDAYRIDHVLGFFRIWEIPVNAIHGLLGQFSPSLGMTQKEIEDYGLQFDESLFTMPFITDDVIERLFKDDAVKVKTLYLNNLHGDVWQLKPEFDTEREIEKAFDGLTSEADKRLRDGLYSLVSDVLFLHDTHDSSKFHPRISAQQNFIYASLPDSDKCAFNRIYNDYFYRRNNHFWYEEAMKKLPRLTQATRMLVCAEDLGMVPDCVPWVMNQLRILGLELQSMPKASNVRFADPANFPYCSVCTISSHDMPTLRQWWDEDKDRAQAFYLSVMHRDDPAPHPLTGWLAEDIVLRNLASPSMLCILSIQDWLAIDEQLRLPDPNGERINIPSDPHHYWRYRMHVNIEDLIENDEFNGKIKSLINDSNRN